MNETSRVKKLAEDYGTEELLIAYIMREAVCNEETARDIYWHIGNCVDDLIESAARDLMDDEDCE